MKNEWNVYCFFPCLHIMLIIFTLFCICLFCLVMPKGGQIVLTHDIHSYSFDHSTMMMIWHDLTLLLAIVYSKFQVVSQEKSLLSSLSKCTQWQRKFGTIKAKKGEIVRDKGANMKIKIKKSFDFYMHNPRLNGICIACCLLSLVNQCVPHASSYRSKKIVSKIRKIICAI